MRHAGGGGDPPGPSPAAPTWPPATGRAGVVFQPLDQNKDIPPRFLTAPAASALVVRGADLAFLPGPSAREEAYLRRVGYDRDCGFAVVHSAGGLLLCSRGRVSPGTSTSATP